MNNLIKYWIVQYKMENGRYNKLRFKTWEDSFYKTRKYEIINDLDGSTTEVTKDDGNNIYKAAIKNYKIKGMVYICKII